VTVTVTADVPTALAFGSPLILPVDASIERPAGKPVAVNR
jgi:hypothetical protein